MKIVNTYELTIKRGRIGFPKGATVFTALAGGSAPEEISMLPSGESSVGVKICAGEAKKENAFGMVDSIVEKVTGRRCSATEIEKAIKRGYALKDLKISTAENFATVTFEALEPDGVSAVTGSDRVTERMKELEKNGIDSMASLQEKVDEMRINGVSDNIILKVLNFPGYEKANDRSFRPKTMFRTPAEELEAARNLGEPTLFARTLMHAVKSKREIFVGPKSVGKNVLSEEIAWLLNVGYDIMTITMSMTSEDVFGNMTTVEPEIAKMDRDEIIRLAKAAIMANMIDAGAEAEIEDAAKFEALRAQAATVRITRSITEVTRAFMEGDVLSLNEMNMGSANTLSLFNQVTDGTGFVEIGGIGRVHINRATVIIGNMNPNYAGAQDLNEALISRFPIVFFQYPKSIGEILHSAVKTPLDEIYFEQSDALYKVLKSSVEDKVISDRALNIRGFVAALEEVGEFPADMKLKAALVDNVVNASVLGGASGESEKVSLLDWIDKKVNV